MNVPAAIMHRAPATKVSSSDLSNDAHQTVRQFHKVVTSDEMVERFKNVNIDNSQNVQKVTFEEESHPWLCLNNQADRMALHRIIYAITNCQRTTHHWHWSENDDDDDLRWVNSELIKQMGPEILVDLTKVNVPFVTSTLAETVVELLDSVDLDGMTWAPPVPENLQDVIEGTDPEVLSISEEAAYIIKMTRYAMDDKDHYFTVAEKGCGNYAHAAKGAFRLKEMCIRGKQPHAVLEGYIFLGDKTYTHAQFGCSDYFTATRVDNPTEFTEVFDHLQTLLNVDDSVYPTVAVDGMMDRSLIDMLNDKEMSTARQRQMAAPVPNGAATPTTCGYQKQLAVLDGELLRKESEQMFQALGGYVGFTNEDGLTAEQEAGLLNFGIAFGFQTKVWLSGALTDMHPVVWKPSIFDNVVMSDERRETIRAMVETDAIELDDIEGKGNNTVFLLNGGTGLGKTLLAEAVAHMKCRSLLKVSFGELGTTVGQVESKMNAYLRYGNRWDSVMLFDESDVFVKTRDTDNLERTALVATFLGLLEYFQGTLFLTTNTEDIDPAIYGRVTMALNYRQEDLDLKAIWAGILKKAERHANFNLTDRDVDQLIDLNLNGRQIKNLLSKAIRVANHQERGVDLDLIERTHALSAGH